MKKYEYMAYIEYYHRCLVNDDIDTQTCKLIIANEIMRAWSDSQISGDDLYNILKHSDRVLQEIVKRIE